MDENAATESREENNESSSHAEENRAPHQQHRRDRRRSKQKHNRPTQQQAASATESSLNLSELRELAELINEQGFTDFEFENEKIRVRLRRELTPQIIQSPVGFSPQSFAHTAAPQPQHAQAQQSAAAPAASQTGAEPVAAAEDENVYKITSPIVGTFYRAPSPGAEPFVKVGSQVASDTIVCIVEAMKLMNEIQAEVSGEIVKIYVDNGQPVEFGQPLFGVKK